MVFPHDEQYPDPEHREEYLDEPAQRLDDRGEPIDPHEIELHRIDFGLVRHSIPQRNQCGAVRRSAARGDDDQIGKRVLSFEDGLDIVESRHLLILGERFGSGDDTHVPHRVPFTQSRSD